MRRAPFVSVGTKLMGAMLFVVTVVTALAYAHVSRSEREQLLAAKEEAATMAMQLFVAGVAPSVALADDNGVRERISLLLTDPNVRYGSVWRVDAGGHRVEQLAEQGDPKGLPPITDSLPGVVVVRQADVVIVDEAIITSSGERLGIVRVVFSLERENAAIASATLRMLLTSFALALLLGVVVILLTRSLIVRPLARLRDAVKRFEAGESVVIRLESNDEVAGLSRAFASMTDAIVTREARISAGNRDMRRVLDNVAEGLMTVNRDGRISSEHSRILEDWFGPPPASRSIFDYFVQFAPTTARMLRLGFVALDDDVMPVEVILEQMPRRFEHSGSSFEIDTLPIWAGSFQTPVVEQLLVVVRDVTAKVARERAERGHREAMNVFRRFLDDRAGFREFVAGAARIVGRLDAEATDAVALLRDVHTLKGNTALYGIDTVAEVCHLVESRAADAGSAPTKHDLDAIREAWARTQAVASEIDRGGDDLVELRPEELDAHVAALEARSVDPRLVDQVRSWNNELASKRLGNVAEQARSIARRLGKTDARVDAEVLPASLRLRAALWAPFWQIFAHVLRNTFDHGIEGPAERRALGKKVGGSVRIVLDATGAGVELRVTDDGRGIDWAKVRRRATSLGLPDATQADLEEAIYAHDVTTRDEVSEFSGRGIGMGAVREAVRACNGTIAIESRASAGTTIRFRFPSEMLTTQRTGSLTPRAA